MPELVTLGPWLRRFLCEHIVTERNLARNTRKSYRDTFSLFCPSSAANCASPWTGWPSVISPPGMVLQFLAHLEEGSRMLCPDPQSAACGNPCVRPLRRQPGSVPCRMVRSHPGYRIEEVHAATGRMADQGGNGGNARRARPQDPAGPQRIRASALSLQHRGTCLRGHAAEGARSADRARNGGHDLATLHGKGGKTRQCPLWPETERVLADEILGRSGDDAVFVSRLRAPFTRFGVYRLIERCAARVPELADRTITPHMIRHTTACHLVLAGVDINTIRAWLGHVSISTTNIYAEIDLTLKANAVALCEVGQPRPARSWKEDKDLMAFLKSL